MRQLPVNSSAPVTITIISPKGNSRPHSTRDSPALVSRWPAVLATTAPEAIRNPASKAERYSRLALLADFFAPTWA